MYWGLFEGVCIDRSRLLIERQSSSQGFSGVHKIGSKQQVIRNLDVCSVSRHSFGSFAVI